MMVNSLQSMGIRIASLCAVGGMLLLGGCESDQDEAAMDGMHSHMATDMVTPKQSGRTMFSHEDIMFAEMMIPHHQQAIEMADLVPSRSQNLQVKALAAQIKDAQQPEIDLMQSWVDSSGSGDMAHMVGSAPMDGMLSESELAKLRAARGVAFDRRFLQGMIAHHEGAILTATPLRTSGTAEVAKLTTAIVESQTADIARMRELLATLP